ncbi:MAG: UvrD-helicase domain-containing protein [Betaproteobacteria bacterium]|nr:UvrD-helicase domain-containing protein [Betaproteobacteria bacterium]
MPLLDNLNAEQLAAVTLPDQHALILAGAGSGKTRVLTTRIAWLISTGNVSPAGVLAVTFTNKAAREMATRISAMLPISTRGMWIGTFHGLCNRLLRAHYRDAGLPQLFQILDAQDQHAFVKRLLKSLNADENRFAPAQVQYFINANKEEGRRAGDVEAFDDFSRRLVEFYAAYDEQCQREGVVDFAELLLRSYELLSRNELLREHYQGRFRHILVDEFQDTNRLQYRWLKLLAGHRSERRDAAGGESASSCLFAVGDDDQSIYRFRGANVGNMADFERDFRVENVIRLEQNYRSQGNILAAANALIANNRRRLGKNLWTQAGKGEPIRVLSARSDAEEAAWVAEEVRSLGREGLARREMAVLYRSNAQSRVLEHALFSAGIPYRVYGGQRYFERLEIKHALAYLRLLANPEDDGAFLRVVNFPPRGIGARTLEQLSDAARAAGTSLWQAVPRVAGKGGSALAAFARTIEALRGETRELPLAEVVEHMLAGSGLLDHFRAERDGADRVENLEELTNAAAAFAQEAAAEGAGAAEPDGPPDPLAGFLAHAALESGEHQAAEGADALQLMTVHSAKGLEFAAVFVTGLEEGLFPHEQSRKEDDGLEEGRRLMYVAITRARSRLYLSFAQTRLLHGQTRYSVASRFVEEIPGEVLKWLAGRVSRPQFEDVAWETPAKKMPVPREIGAMGYRIGQSVTHPKFGQGVVVSAEGSGTDTRLQINFGRQGMKWLALEYAKLTPA